MATTIAPPAQASEARAPEIVRVEFAKPEPKEAKAPQDPGPAAKAAEENRALREAENNTRLVPDRLVVEKDEAAGRFVQTRIDSASMETVLRYPSESQLAYSRAVAAYLRTMLQS